MTAGQRLVLFKEELGSADTYVRVSGGVSVQMIGAPKLNSRYTGSVEGPSSTGRSNSNNLILSIQFDFLPDWLQLDYANNGI